MDGWMGGWVWMNWKMDKDTWVGKNGWMDANCQILDCQKRKSILDLQMEPNIDICYIVVCAFLLA